jgi:hypothetical protein
MPHSFQTPRALSVLDAANVFTIWLSGAWGMESRPALLEALHRTPCATNSVTVDCRRMTLIDGPVIQAFAQFADECLIRSLPCIFECDEDPVSRIALLVGCEGLTIAHRPLHQRQAHAR